MEKFTDNRNFEIIEKISTTYYNLLINIDLKDELTAKGINEGLNKFLSNAFLYIGNKDKYHQGDFYSKNAADIIKTESKNELIYEHMVPKNKYIQKPCVEEAIKGTLTKEFVFEKLKSYWFIAIITKNEDKKLKGKTMPNGWDRKNIFSRYDEAGVKLYPKEYFNDSFDK